MNGWQYHLPSKHQLGRDQELQMMSFQTWPLGKITKTKKCIDDMHENVITSVVLFGTSHLFVLCGLVGEISYLRSYCHFQISSIHCISKSNNFGLTNVGVIKSKLMKPWSLRLCNGDLHGYIDFWTNSVFPRLAK